MTALAVSLLFPNAIQVMALKNPHSEMYAQNPEKRMVEEKVMEYCYRLSHSKHDLF